jgi:hypothetical protein
MFHNRQSEDGFVTGHADDVEESGFMTGTAHAHDGPSRRSNEAAPAAAAAPSNNTAPPGGIPKYEGISFAIASRHFQDTLPKRVAYPGSKTGFRLALPGEERSADGEPAKHYPNPFMINAEELDEFGLGVGLYFRSLKLTFGMILICAFIGLVAIYQNMKTNPTQAHIDSFGGNNTYADLTVCPEIELGSTYGATRDNLKLNQQGAASIAISLTLGVFAMLAWKLETLLADGIDANWSTTQDYAVVVTNPHRDVDDPKEYQSYFNQFTDARGGGVCCVTVAKNNGDLCCEIANKKRFQHLRHVMAHSGNTTTTSDLPWWKQRLQSSGYYLTIDYLDKAIEECTNKISALSHKDYLPWRVFVVFNTEEEQRECLRRTAMSGVQAVGIETTENSDLLFRETRLRVAEAPEPSDIIYENTHRTYWERVASWVLSYFVCACVVIAAFFIIRALANNGNVGAAIFISVVNSFLPVFAKMVTITVEIHNKHSNIQYAILAKLVIIRCMVSGVIIFISSPFDETFSLKHLQSMMNILLADAISTPALRFFDVNGLVDRWVMGYFATTQAELNQLWTASEWTLAERYTDVLKSIFIGTFFSVPLPQGLFITAFCLANDYFVDKFSLMRLWQRPPALDRSLAVLSRYVYILIVWAQVSVSRVYFANWPYGVRAQCVVLVIFTCMLLSACSVIRAL